jgi:hypothetical protein
MKKTFFDFKTPKQDKFLRNSSKNLKTPQNPHKSRQLFALHTLQKSLS